MHDPLSAPPDPLLSPRKSRRGLLAIVFAVVLVLGAGAWWYFTRTPEGATADGQAAKVCTWHIFTEKYMRGKEHLDTSEGYVQDSSDRMFWSRVYANLAMADVEDS